MNEEQGTWPAGAPQFVPLETRLKLTRARDIGAPLAVSFSSTQYSTTEQPVKVGAAFDYVARCMVSTAKVDGSGASSVGVFVGTSGNCVFFIPASTTPVLLGFYSPAGLFFKASGTPGSGDSVTFLFG